jgi:hypothetical protein
MNIYEWLKHPLLLLLVTALISNYLIPRITRRWQDYQKEIELKTTIVSEISEAVLSIVMAVQFSEGGAKSQTQEEYDKAYRNWEIRRAIIASKIGAYFPNSELVTKWYAFSETLTEIYALSGTTDRDYRRERLSRIQQYLIDADINWDTLFNYQIKKEGFHEFQKYYKVWFSLKEAILGRKDDLIALMLSLPSTLTDRKLSKMQSQRRSRLPHVKISRLTSYSILARKALKKNERGD